MITNTYVCLLNIICDKMKCIIIHTYVHYIHTEEYVGYIALSAYVNKTYAKNEYSSSRIVREQKMLIPSVKYPSISTMYSSIPISCKTCPTFLHTSVSL